VYHNVYLGTDADAVANADDSSAEFLGTVTSAVFVPQKLEVNTVYYWRVDEIGAACGAAGEIWSLRSDRGLAKEPNPPNAAEAVAIDVVINWWPGPLAVSHDVYLGTDFNDVNDANTISQEYKGGQSTTVYDLNDLEYDTTYYWRVDEVNGLNTWKGDVWHFTTCEAPDSYLVGWWKFDEADGNTAYDSAGSGHGAVYGAEWTTGQVYGALSFDGNGDYVVVPDRAELNPTSAITIAAWINTNTWSDGNRRILQKGDGDNQYRFLCQGGFMFDLCGVSNGNLVATLPSEGIWHHVAATYDGSTMKIFVDVEEIAAQSAGGQISTTSDSLHIGTKKVGAPPGDHFNGIIDDVRIYNRALAQNELWKIATVPAYDPNLSYNPNPAHEQENVSPYTALGWLPGAQAADVDGHDVYLGTGFNDVNDAGTVSDEYKGRQTANNYDPNGLEYDTTYYWRIDQVNGPAVWKGDVWYFTTCGAPDSYLVGWWKFDEGVMDLSTGPSGRRAPSARWTLMVSRIMWLCRHLT
jgi:hypothetical protein